MRVTFGMVCRPLKAALYNFPTADGGRPTAFGEGSPSTVAVGGQICKDRLDYTQFFIGGERQSSPYAAGE
jgi:hypothetical protein